MYMPVRLSGVCPVSGMARFICKNNEIVASGVRTYSVVSNDVNNPTVLANIFITLSTPPIDLACSILKLIVFILFKIDFVG